MIENITKVEDETLSRAASEFQKAWNSGDAKNISNFFTEDAKRVGSFGEVQNGRIEIEEAYKGLLHRAWPGAQISIKGETTRLIDPEMAVWQANFEILSPESPTSIKGYVVQIMKKENGKWLILEMHPKIFPLQDQDSLQL